MRAVWYERFGPAREVLTLGDLPTPEPAAGELRVRLAASGVNPSDVKLRAGGRPGMADPPWPKIVPHSDGAGTVDAVGACVDAAWVGRRVWVWNAQWQRPLGTAAEAVVLPESRVAPLPDGVPFEVGAGLGIPALTAAHGVFCDGPVDGRTVLVSGGGGTVGQLAVQFARHGGARVIATVGRPQDADRARAAGADAVVDFRREPVARRVLDLTGGAGVDRAVEVEFGANADLLAEVIKPRGRIAAYGSALAPRPELPFYPLMFKGVVLTFVLVYLLEGAERAAAVARVNEALAAGRLDVPVSAVFDLADAAAAHEAVEAGGRAGAVVLRPHAG